MVGQENKGMWFFYTRFEILVPKFVVIERNVGLM